MSLGPAWSTQEQAANLLAQRKHDLERARRSKHKAEKQSLFKETQQ